MAQAFVESLGRGCVVAESAGTMPAERVNPVVVEAMRERGILIGDAKPKLLTPEMVDEVDRVVTMGCSVEKECPWFSLPADDWGLDDPEGKPIERVREIRDEIEVRVKDILGGLQKP